MIFRFRTCVIESDDHSRYLTTRFDDGSSTTIAPNEEVGTLEGARASGAGDLWEHQVQHELGHALLADARGLRHSPSVWASAHGRGESTPPDTWPESIKKEEHLVIMLQRLAFDDRAHDPWGVIQHELGHSRYMLARRLKEMTDKILRKTP